MFRFFALIALAAPCAAQNMDWTNIFVADCNAGAHIFPNTPAEINMNGDMVKMALDTVEGIVRAAAQNACPQMDDKDFHDWMAPSIQWALKSSLPRADEAALYTAWAKKCPKLAVGGLDFMLGIRNATTSQGTTINDEASSTIRSILPTTCTYERYAAGTGCGMAFKLQSLGIEIRGVATKCPNSAMMPFGKIQCRGNGCADIGKPCDVDADCGGASNDKVVCTPMISASELTNQKIFDGMTDSDLLLKKTDKVTYAAQAASFCAGITDFGSEGALGMITDAKSWMKKKFYFDSAVAQAKGSEVKICYLQGSYSGPTTANLFDRFKKDVGKGVQSGIFDKVESDIETNMKENGGSVLSPFANKVIGTSQLNGAGFSTPLIANKDAATPTLFYENCLGEGGFSLFNPRIGGAMSMPAQQLFFSRAIKYLKDSQYCRADLYKTTRLTDNQFRMSWSAWQMNRWLHQLDVNAKGGDKANLSPQSMWGLLDYLFSDTPANMPQRRLLGGPAAGGAAPTSESFSAAYSALEEIGTKLSVHPIARQLMGELNQATHAARRMTTPTTTSSSSSSSSESEDGFTKLTKLTNWVGIKMPKSCTYQTYRDLGQCLVSYDGIGKMIDMETGLKFSIKRCSGDELKEGQPAGAFGISGPFTKSIQKPTACSSNSDCGTNQVCQDFWALKDIEGNALMTPKIEEDMTKGYQETVGGFVYGREGPTHLMAPKFQMTTASMKTDFRAGMKALAYEKRDTSSSMQFCIPDWESAKKSFEGKSGGWPTAKEIDPTTKQEKQKDFDFGWLNKNLAPTVNGESIVAVIQEMMGTNPTTGTKNVDKLMPGPKGTRDAAIYWNVDVPQLNKDRALMYPNEELVGGVNVKAKFNNWPLASCIQFNFAEQRAFQAAVAKIASNDKFTVDPNAVRVTCTDATTATTRRLDSPQRALSDTVTLESEIRSVPGDQAGNVVGAVSNIGKDQTFATALKASKLAYAPEPVDVTENIIDYSKYTTCTDNGGCPVGDLKKMVDLKCICASACAKCDAVPPAGSAERTALENKIKADATVQQADAAAEEAAITAEAAKVSSTVTVTDVQAVSNGVADVSGDDNSGLGAGALAGIIIGALVAVALVAFAGVTYGKKLAKKKMAVTNPGVDKVSSTTNNPVQTTQAAAGDAEYADEM